MTLDAKLRRIVLKLNKKYKNNRSSIHLSVSPSISGFRLHEGSLELLTERVLVHALAFGGPDRRIHVAVSLKGCMADLEEFFALSPARWIHLSTKGALDNGFENTMLEILMALGYRCSEWIGVEDSEAKLGAFHYGSAMDSVLIVYVRNRGARCQCDFLIPITEPAVLIKPPNIGCSETARQ